MPNIERLTESTDWIDLSVVEHDRTPREIIETGIRYYLAELSIWNTVMLIDSLGVDWSRVAIHNFVQETDLQPTGGEHPDRVAVDQQATRINDQQYWLYAAVDPETNRILLGLFPTQTIPIARKFLTELAKNHDVSDVVFLVDDADDLTGALRRENYNYRVQVHGYRNQVERVFREIENRTSSFSNCFSHVDPATAETWLQAHADWWNYT